MAGTSGSALGKVVTGIEEQAKLRPGWSFVQLQTPGRVERQVQVNKTFWVPPHHLFPQFHRRKHPDPSLMPSDLFCQSPGLLSSFTSLLSTKQSMKVCSSSQALSQGCAEGRAPAVVHQPRCAVLPGPRLALPQRCVFRPVSTHTDARLDMVPLAPLEWPFQNNLWDWGESLAKL